MSGGTQAISPVDGPFGLENAHDYARWRAEKLARYPREAAELVVEIEDLYRPSAQQRARIADLCRRANMAVYVNSSQGRDETAVRPALRAFGAAFGLVHAEDHRSAGADGIVAIEIANEGGRAGYIPYSPRPIDWHTDGYYKYRSPSDCIPAMLLHCVRAAAHGGENAVLDQDIAYIRLRDENPAFVAALMHPAAMTIPANVEPDGRTRQTSSGPVYFVDPRTGALVMRYTARTRNIVWRDDPITRQAVQFLEHVLDNDPLVLRHRLSPGEGFICNNVLHTRSGFENEEGRSGRLLYRVRYHNRVAGVDGLPIESPTGTASWQTSAT